MPALWLSEFDSTTTILSAAPPRFETVPLPSDFLRSASAREKLPDGIHASLAENSSEHRIHITTRTAFIRPAALIPIDGHEEERIMALRRLLRRVRGRSVKATPRQFEISPFRMWNYAEAIMVHDGTIAGASPRDIGAVMDPSVSTISSAEWDVHPLRKRIGRRLDLCRSMMNGRYLDLVRRHWRRAS